MRGVVCGSRESFRCNGVNCEYWGSEAVDGQIILTLAAIVAYFLQSPASKTKVSRSAQTFRSA